MSSSADSHHVLIIGAGITGLTLAQALRKQGVPFTIFERDPGPDYRGKGWGITVHWALDSFLSLLPQDLIDRIPETYVNPDAVANGLDGKFQFFDLRTGEAKWSVPPSRRIRTSRERLRKLLMEGLDIQWNKTLSEISKPSNTSICAHFTDGSSASGTQLIGCDGHRSKTRRWMCSHGFPAGKEVCSENHKLPVRLLGVSVPYHSSLAEKVHNLDPYFLQGGDPETDVFLYFSFLDTPSNNTRAERDTYECQIMISWPYRSKNPKLAPVEVPADNDERLRLMRSMADNWVEPFGEIVRSIPDGTEAKAISLEDWVPPKKGSWNNLGGRVTLIGDAAHGMTMYRGEAGNHGLLDVANFIACMAPIFKLSPRNPSFPAALKKACDAYEGELLARGIPAVLRSRQACLDAHNHVTLNDQSPLVGKRAPYINDQKKSKAARLGVFIRGPFQGLKRFTQGQRKDESET